jgi:hypothetical protein
MSRVVSIVGAGLLSVGLLQGWTTYSFLQHAQVVIARVASIEELRGPPKPRQKTPVNLLYKGKDGLEQSAVAHLPLLQNIRRGDEIRILVDSKEPQVARLPLWSELWARSLTYLVGGSLLILVGRVLRTRKLR